MKRRLEIARGFIAWILLQQLNCNRINIFANAATGIGYQVGYSSDYK
ncbi:MAG TPA: hypothetical protein VN958_19145 [Chitinophagaceae bacterium]|nr:hypothetical protein [Chitinophagaceae bacterium]